MNESTSGSGSPQLMTSRVLEHLFFVRTSEICPCSFFCVCASHLPEHFIFVCERQHARLGDGVGGGGGRGRVSAHAILMDIFEERGYWDVTRVLCKNVRATYCRVCKTARHTVGNCT